MKIESFSGYISRSEMATVRAEFGKQFLYESYPPAAFFKSSVRSVFSQVNSGSLRPKCPPEAVNW